MNQQYDVLSRFYDDISGHNQAQWTDYLSRVLAHYGVAPGARIADMACGTGGLSIALWKAGYHVTGMDVSMPMLTRAAQNAAQEGAGVAFVHGDMAQPRLPRHTDAVTCNCDGVNYLLDEAELGAFFAGCARALSRGVLLFDISTPYKLHGMDGEFFGEEYDDMAYLWSNQMDPHSRVLTMDLTFFIRQGDLYAREQETHRQRAWEVGEIIALLNQAGFAQVDVYEWGDLQPPEPTAQRIQFVARSGA